MPLLYLLIRQLGFAAEAELRGGLQLPRPVHTARVRNMDSDLTRPASCSTPVSMAPPPRAAKRNRTADITAPLMKLRACARAHRHST